MMPHNYIDPGVDLSYSDTVAYMEDEERERQNRLKLYMAAKYVAIEFYGETGMDLVCMWKAVNEEDGYWKKTCLNAYERSRV